MINNTRSNPSDNILSNNTVNDKSNATYTAIILQHSFFKDTDFLVYFIINIVVTTLFFTVIIYIFLYLYRNKYFLFTRRTEDGFELLDNRPVDTATSPIEFMEKE